MRGLKVNVWHPSFKEKGLLLAKRKKCTSPSSKKKKKCTSPISKKKKKCTSPSKKEKHLSQQLVQFRLSHENTNVVKSSSQIVLINCPILNNSNQQYQWKSISFSYLQNLSFPTLINGWWWTLFMSINLKQSLYICNCSSEKPSPSPLCSKNTSKKLPDSVDKNLDSPAHVGLLWGCSAEGDWECPLSSCGCCSSPLPLGSGHPADLNIHWESLSTHAPPFTLLKWQTETL